MTTRHRYRDALIRELQDLVRHAEELLDWYVTRKKSRDITEHVLFENKAVLENEKVCLENFKRELERVDPDDYATLDDMIEDIKARFKRLVRACGYVRCAYLFAEHKIDKVRERLLADTSVHRKAG